MQEALGNKLVELGLIKIEQLQGSLKTAFDNDEPLLQVIIDSGFSTESELLSSLSGFFRIKTLEEPLSELNLDVAQSLPKAFCRTNLLLPYKHEDGILHVAITNPVDFQSIESVKVITEESNLVIRMVSVSQLKDMMSRVYSDSNIIVDEDSSSKKELTEEEIEEANISNRVDNAPLVRLVNSIIVDAFQANASDIHIEPEENFTRVRFRVDGGLYVYKEFPKNLHDRIVTRIKIIAEIDVSNRQIPHDGSFKFKSQYVSVDLRVSTLPTPDGEKVVMRLLGADKNVTYDLYSLGLSDHTIETIESAIQVPNGIFLVTGPTGSGKTTTLYSILHLLSKGDNSVVTVEDPVERNFPGITQVQINDKAGLTFSKSLRSILRQDPDTIMIGEMRDSETAEIATRSAITGHFVLSTIHTNDALSTVSRLVDMGVEPYMIASSLKCVIAQRLVRKICKHCKKENIVSDIERKLISVDTQISHVGEGCDKCNNTGYSGRTAVFEIVVIDSPLQRLIAKEANIDVLKSYIEDKGVRTMKTEVMELVDAGITTIEEAVKILYSVD